jgi:hypothetical protein
MSESDYFKTIKEIFPTDIKYKEMSKKTRTFFSTIIKRLNKGFNSWTDVVKNITNSPIEYLTHSNFITHSEYNYIPTDIRDIIGKQSVYQKSHSIRIGKREYTIDFIHPVDASDKNINTYFIKSIKQIYLWLYLIAPYIPVGCSDKTDFYIFFTDHKKQLPQSPGSPIGEIHVNTAFTTSCKPSTNVYIYRKEEWFKVLIHETFHNMGLDFSSMDDSQSNRIILDNFPINAPNGIRLYESYCEMWAEMMNILFISFNSTRDKTSESLIMDKMNVMLEKEIMFSTFQCVKILKHYNMTYKQLTTLNCEKSKKSRLQYSENSYIFSYFIAKSIIMSNPNRFIEWCEREGESIT